MMINLLFSMVGPRMSEEAASAFSAYAQWVVLNERNGRLLVDAIGEQAAVSAAFSALNLMGRDPIVIGMWQEDGAKLDNVNLEAWLDVAPDVLSTDEEGEAVTSRPTQWSDIHRWSGWGEKQ